MTLMSNHEILTYITKASQFKTKISRPATKIGLHFLHHQTITL